MELLKPLSQYTSINLGRRQEGRIFAKSVTNVRFNKRLITQQIKKIYTIKKEKVINPYYKKNTANEIIRIIKKI